MSLSDAHAAQIGDTILSSLSDGDKHAFRQVYGITPFADSQSKESYRIFAEKSGQLPDRLRQNLFDLLTLSDSDLAMETSAGTPAQLAVTNSMLKFFPDEIIKAFNDFQDLSEASKKNPENAYAASIDNVLLRKAVRAAPFYYQDEYLDDLDEEELKNPSVIKIDWASYTDEELKAAASVSNPAEVIGAISHFENRPGVAEIIIQSADNDPKSAFMQSVRLLGNKPYLQSSLEGIISKSPELLFTDYDSIKIQKSAVLDAFLKPQNLSKLQDSAHQWGNDFLAHYNHYQNESFSGPLAEILAEKNPLSFFTRPEILRLPNIGKPLLMAVRNDPGRALNLMNDEEQAYRAPGATGTLKDEAIAHMQTYLDRNAGNDTDPELIVVRRLNMLHEKPDNIRFESISQLNTSGYFQLLTEGRSEAYTSTYNHLYKGFVDRLIEMDHKGFSEFLHANLDRLKNLPSFIEGLSTFGQFNDFISRIGQEEKELLTSTIADQLKNDPLNVVSAANFIRNLPKDDPSLKLMESRIIDGYSSSKGSERDMYGTLGRWYAENPHHAVSIDNARAFNTFMANDRYKMPDFERVEPAQLFDSSNRHFQMHVFYNDEDGFANYDYFSQRMSHEGWTTKIDAEKGIAHFEKTQSGRQVNIYATIPHKGTDPNNSAAVQAIQKEVADQAGKITFVAHRGHSYHVDDTIDNLNSQAEIVFLGACGGTQFIQATLDKSPRADIIATSGTGTRFVNEPLLAAINQKILAGQPIIWAEMKAVTEKVKDARAEQYMMPNENMAAVFISKLNELKEQDKSLSQEKSNLNQSFSTAHDGVIPSTVTPGLSHNPALVQAPAPQIAVPAV